MYIIQLAEEMQVDQKNGTNKSYEGGTNQVLSYNLLLLLLLLLMMVIMVTIIIIIIIIIIITMIMMTLQNKYLRFRPTDSHKRSFYVVLNLKRRKNCL